eukprot:g1522.t1
MFALVARILFWVSLWASVVARTEASPPIVLRGNPLAVRASRSVSAVLMVAIMAGGMTSASAKRCDTVIPDLPLTTTKIDKNTCDEGTIPPDIGKLVKLTVLNFRAVYDLSGTLPPDIGKLVKLTALSVSSTSIEGAIPPDIGKLVNLERLSFAMSFGLAKIEGAIPPDIGNLVKLSSLWLSDTDIEGTLPPDIWNLVKLTLLDVATTKIEGTLSPDIGKLVKL